jgi:hypothetical protein
LNQLLFYPGKSVHTFSQETGFYLVKTLLSCYENLKKLSFSWIENRHIYWLNKHSFEGKIIGWSDTFVWLVARIDNFVTIRHCQRNERVKLATWNSSTYIARKVLTKVWLGKRLSKNFRRKSCHLHRHVLVSAKDN